MLPSLGYPSSPVPPDSNSSGFGEGWRGSVGVSTSGVGLGVWEREKGSGRPRLLPILLRHDAGLMLLLFEMDRAAASEVEEPTRTNTPWAGRTLSAGGGESAGSRRPPSCPPTCQPQTPRHRDPSARLVAEQGGGEGGGVQEGRSPPLRAPHHHTPASFFSCYLCAGGSTAGSLEETPAA